MSFNSNDFYLAVANQTRYDVNSPIVANQNSETQTPGSLTCQVCPYNYCYNEAVNYIGNGILNLDEPNTCGYTTATGCDTGDDTQNTCGYNGSILDWSYNTLHCAFIVGGKFPLCSTVDPELCTLYNPSDPSNIDASYTGYINNTLNTACAINEDVGIYTPCKDEIPDDFNAFVSWNNKNDIYNDQDSGRYIDCNYRKTLFTDNLGIIQSYYNNYIDPNSKIVLADGAGKANTSNLTNYNVIMQDFSQGISTDTDATCPLYTIYPYNGSNPTVCSRFIATGDQGDWVRSWILGTQVKNSVPSIASYSDNAKINYCTDPNNFNSPECQCINRTTVDPNYNSTQQLLDAPPACWYIPCQDSSKYLITSDISSTECTSNICENINVNIANGHGTINANELTTISCTVNSSDTNSRSGLNFNIPTWLWIVLGVGILIFIIIIIVLIMRSSGKKKEE